MAKCTSLSLFWFAITSCSANENRVTYQLGRQGSFTSLANFGTASIRDTRMTVGHASASLHFLAQGTLTERSTRLLLAIPSWHLASDMRAFDAKGMAEAACGGRNTIPCGTRADIETDVSCVRTPSAFVQIWGKHYRSKAFTAHCTRLYF